MPIRWDVRANVHLRMDRGFVAVCGEGELEVLTVAKVDVGIITHVCGRWRRGRSGERRNARWWREGAKRRRRKAPWRVPEKVMG